MYYPQKMTYSYSKQTKALNKTKSTKQMKNKKELNHDVHCCTFIRT